MSKKKLAFSGVQPTGNLHLGNYLGALRNFVSLQNEMDCIYCVVDLHAITVFQKPNELHDNVLETTASFLATGLNPDKSIIFNQSSVSGHAELAWILNCVSRIGWLNRMTQFKDKAGKNRENVSVGLMVYPNLMAADILAYLATHVPVGDDQKQHLELSRDIAQKFNNDFGVEYFPQPEPLIYGNATRVMSLRDGTKKMSKSDPSDLSRINMGDDADTIFLKFKKAKTDAEALPSEIDGLKDRPEAENLVTIYSALSEQSMDRTLQEVGGKQFSEFKPILAECAVEILSPISQELNRLMQNTDEIDSILASGAKRAREIAGPILEKTYDIVGILKPK